MANDEFHNSTGYFKDPGTGQDLTGDEPRVTTCHSGEPFKWPMITLSDGNIVKLCSRLWNADEKQCYKEYRNGGTCVKSERKPRECKPKSKSEPEPETNENEKCVVKYNEECVASGTTEEIITMCDILLGVSQIDGIFFALLSKRNSNMIYHIPRSLISDADFDRLCRGNDY